MAATHINARAGAFLRGYPLPPGRANVPPYMAADGSAPLCPAGQNRRRYAAVCRPFYDLATGGSGACSAGAARSARELCTRSTGRASVGAP